MVYIPRVVVRKEQRNREPTNNDTGMCEEHEEKHNQKHEGEASWLKAITK
jgi:hypothetical protein